MTFLPNAFCAVCRERVRQWRVARGIPRPPRRHKRTVEDLEALVARVRASGVTKKVQAAEALGMDMRDFDAAWRDALRRTTVANGILLRSPRPDMARRERFRNLWESGIPTADIAGLDPEVRDHDPHLALDGGPDGLQAYRELAPEIRRILRPGGFFAVEIGWDQGPQVKAMFEAEGFRDVIVVKDLSDRDRVVTNGPDPRTNPIPKM